MPSLAADAATIPTASAATALAASFSPDANVGTAAGATATAASTANIGTEVGTDPVPITTVPPTTEHISSFLSYVRWRSADDATRHGDGRTHRRDTDHTPRSCARV